MSGAKAARGATHAALWQGAQDILGGGHGAEGSKSSDCGETHGGWFRRVRDMEITMRAKVGATRRGQSGEEEDAGGVGTKREGRAGRGLNGQRATIYFAGESRARRDRLGC